MVKKVALILVLVVFVGALGLGFWLYRDILGSDPDRAAETESTETTTSSSPQAPLPPPAPWPKPRLEPVQPDQPAQPEVWTVRVTEQEANRLIRTRPEIRDALKDAKISGLRLRFEPDSLNAEARVPVWGKMKARVNAAARLWAEHGDLRLEVTSVKLGSVPAPTAVREELQKQLAKAIGDLNEDQRGRVKEVTVRDQELLIRAEKTAH